jgi:transcriptional regulator GlxA family with amidase domain
MSGKNQPKVVGFLLIPDFGLLSYASAIEPLRAANVLSGQQLYCWRHLSPDGTPVVASNGIYITPDAQLKCASTELDALFVLAGGNRISFDDADTFNLLRRFSRLGRPIAGIGGGPYVLARAGVLDGYRFTLHREYAPALREEFPQLDVRRTLFEVDRNRLTSSGGTTSLDMMHTFLSRDHGPELAARVSDWFMQTDHRAASQPQRMPLSQRIGVQNQATLRAVACMEANIEAPLGRAEIAAAAGVSARQLERLFVSHLGCTPGRYYLQLRLQRARGLLRQSGLSITQVGVACGFGSTNHFSRAYRQKLGLSPAQERTAPTRVDVSSRRKDVAFSRTGAYPNQ